MACLNGGVFGSSDEPFTTPSMVNLPDAPGSGNALTPLLRMHVANFTALRVAAVAAAATPLPLAAGGFEPHALIRAIMAIRAWAASSRTVIFMLSPAGSDRVDRGATPGVD